MFLENLNPLYISIIAAVLGFPFVVGVKSPQIYDRISYCWQIGCLLVSVAVGSVNWGYISGAYWMMSEARKQSEIEELPFLNLPHPSTDWLMIVFVAVGYSLALSFFKYIYVDQANLLSSKDKD